MNSPRVSFLLLLCLGLINPILVNAGEILPLQPIDTSSPRSTLSSFLKIMNAAYVELSEVKTSYLVSDRLYFSENEKEHGDRVTEQIKVAARALDLSMISFELITKHEVAARRALQLKSILDRLELPPLDNIPDVEMMEPLTFKRWTIPDTEITIQRVEKGPRSGEYLFTTETVERLPEFYKRMEGIQYLSDGSPGWYESHRNSTWGLALIYPLPVDIEDAFMGHADGIRPTYLALDRTHRCVLCVSSLMYYYTKNNLFLVKAIFAFTILF